MSIPDAPLAQVARLFKQHLADGLDAASNNIEVTLGPPKPPSNQERHRVNVFFYRVAPSDAHAGHGPDQPAWLYVHCLITAFGVDENQATPSENALMLLGGVMRILHEQPILEPWQIGARGRPGQEAKAETIRLRVIMEALSLDDLNKLWSTQESSSFQMSVGYQLALVPILPLQARPSPARVGGVDVRTGGRLARPGAVLPDAREGMTSSGRQIRTRLTVDAAGDRQPRIGLLWKGGLHDAVALPIGAPESIAFEAAVVVAGAPGDQVSLVWQVWRPATGWAPAETPAFDLVVDRDSLDPTNPPAAPTAVLELPIARDERGQAQLNAVLHDGQHRRVSNPILITFFGDPQ